MMDRILTGWTFRRILYAVSGVLLVLFSIFDHQWWGVAIGGYFMAMGVFSFGCAGNQCVTFPKNNGSHEQRALDAGNTPSTRHE